MRSKLGSLYHRVAPLDSPALVSRRSRMPIAAGGKVFLYGDELASAIATPLTRLLEARRLPVEKRWGSSWSPFWAQLGFPRRGDAAILAGSHLLEPVPGRALTPNDLEQWARGRRLEGVTTLIVTSICSPDREVLALVAKRAGVAFHLLRQGNCVRDARTPTLGTAAVWAADVGLQFG